jgi:hypothetical protein
MRKVILIASLVTFVAATTAVAARLDRVPNGKAGKSTTAHVYLFEKDPTTWEIVPDGAWGKMRYRTAGPYFDFTFNGHHLEPGWEYTLVYYPDPWPANGLICLGTGMADDYGDVHIAGDVDTGSLPAEYDENYGVGAKIWLIGTGDADCDMQYMVGWNPTEYLFEYDLITYDAGDGPAFRSPMLPVENSSWGTLKATFR